MAPRKKSMARSLSRDATPTRSVVAADKSPKGYAKERPPVPTKISMAYGAPGRVTMPQRLRPKSKNVDVAEAIQEALDEDETAQQSSPPGGTQDNVEPPQTADNQGSSDDEDEEQEAEGNEDEEEDQDEDEDEDIEERNGDNDGNNSTERDEDEEQPEKLERTKPPGVSRRSATPSTRQNLGPPPGEKRRSFATEARIASEARFRRPAVPFHVKLRHLQNYLSEQWDRYGGQAILDILVLFLKVSFVVVVSILSYQQLRPYMPTLNFDFPSIRGPLSTGILSESKSVLDTRPLTRLQEQTTHQYNALKARIDEMELSYNRLAKQVSALPPKHKVNFFALGSGVIIDPYLTSPTRRGGDSFRPGDLLYWIRGLPARPAPAPFMALTAWDDMGDCWCAPDSGGKAQLVLSLQKWVVPQELVVEHIPMKATLDAGAAPKDIELWVQILDPQRRAAVTKAALQYKITSPDIENQTETYFTRRSLDKTWIRVGQWQYNLLGPNNIQNFEIPVPLEHFGAPVSRLAIRTLSNWGGSDFVCLYRLKLHGLVATEANAEEGASKGAME